MKNNEKLARDFYLRITDNKTKKQIFEHISDEDCEAIKSSFTNETRNRNKKLYYRFENPLTNKIEWCVESKLGAYLKSTSFKQHLKRLGLKRRANRNNHKEVYVYPERAKKPYKTAQELEDYFIKSDCGKCAQSATLTMLEERPSELTELQS